MKMKISALLAPAWLLSAGLHAQAGLECNPTAGLPIVESNLNFNYGNVSNAFNQNYKSTIIYGQPLVGAGVSQNYIMNGGFWSSQQLPPQAPSLSVSQGDFPDRVLLAWNVDPLSAPPSDGFIIKRDGAFLAAVSSGTKQFIDFNVQAGEFYQYSVQGVNDFGEGDTELRVGFVNPNGLVIGQVTTFSGNPVDGALVTLTPTVGKSLAFDGADDHLCVSYGSTLPDSVLSASFWVKVGSGHDRDGILDLGSDLVKNWWIHTTPAGLGKGVVAGFGDGSVHETIHEFTQDPDGWHHVAVSYGGGVMLLYVDGELVQSMNAGMSHVPALFTIGSRRDKTGSLHGKLDDVRIYDRFLTQSELILTKDVTVSRNTPGLVAYWKFDEGLGTRAFDISGNAFHADIFGAAFQNDMPGVKNAGITNVQGYYAIEGVNYQTNQLFTATPSKNFYNNYSLEFNAINRSRADLTDFDLPDSAAVTVTLKAFDFGNKQAILSKADAAGSNKFALCLDNGNLDLVVEGAAHTFGTLDMSFHHIALNLRQQGNSLLAEVYQDGVLLGSHSFSGVSADWAGLPWKVGARADGPASHSDFFTGLVDEVVFFDKNLTLPQIQSDANIGTDLTRLGTRSVFGFNEGSGESVRDDGPAFSGQGLIHGASWSVIAKVNGEIPHEFNPGNRLVTLNPSSTSVDQVDFTDMSTIPVSGYVRFEGTNCFHKKVEILVNGLSYVPRVFTDAEGRFVIDLEPGKTYTLTPVYEGHVFYPGFWELPKVSVPVAGILFQNQTKRKVQGQLGGGYCRKSVIPDGSIVKVKVATLNGCFEKVLQLTNPDGKFTFENVPPDSVTVAVIEHSNPVLYNYFQLLGGATLDLRLQDDTTDFIYFAPPNVELTPLPVNECGDPMLNMLQTAKTTVKVYEDYDGGRCYVDTALLTINNDIAALNQFDTLMTTGSFIHNFKADAPNIVPPYLKTLQVTAEAHDEQATKVLTAVVTGRRPRQTAFTSTAPELPTLILRDPPGDGSFAFMESGETTCQDWSFEFADVFEGTSNVTAHLGPDIETEQGTPFFATSLQVDVTADLGINLGGSTTSYTSSSMETCLTTTKVISTSTDQYIVGSDMGGDVYMGGAMNFIFGITDELLFDTANCAFVLDKGLYVFPEGFATTFIYSERQITENIIPDLLLIADTASAQRWQGIIDYNRQLKEEAVFSKNISFDAGIVYEESEATEVTKSVTNSWTQTFSAGFAAEFGVTVNGLGVTAGLEMSWTTEKTSSSTSTATTSRTVGYSLADDDIGDNFTINVKKDRAYGTPVFELVSGQTQCPHEPNTQPREGVDLAADKQVAVNVPMNDVAVFKLTLGNTSQSEEMKFYTLEGLQENNPDGAVIRFNGQPTVNVGIPFGESIEVTMTVGRGPLAFEYQNLRVGFFSDCELERADALGIDPPAGFNEELEFDVYFLEPCSPVNVAFPLEGWVVTPAGGNILNITVAEYDKADPDLELVRVQYRRTVGDGAWINIADVAADDLGNVFTIVPWNTQGLQDGLYEIRAITQCYSGALNPGISHIIKGRIERTPPEVFGTPEPADGVLSSGDEVSIAFTEPIRCDLLIQADFFNNNNVGLYNTRTGDLVDAVVTCEGNKVVIVPNVPNKFIENEILRVEVDSVKDLAGNKFGHEDWEFFVDRNALRWLGGGISSVIYEGDALTVSREIQNIGGGAMAYTITGVPDWVDVFPKEGSLAPGASQVVTFMFKAELPRGEYHDTIRMEGVLGDEPLVVHLRKLCKGPVWELDPGAYSYSMNFTVQLNIEGTLSTDEMDRVGAFVNGQLRGWAFLQHEEDIDKHVAFLTVYSNSVSGEAIEFQIWDANDCLLYGEVVESFSFTLDALVGSPLAPQVLHTNNLLLRRIPLTPGWNWVSFNLDAPDKATGNVLGSLNNPQGGLVKSQTQFSQYSVPLSQWLGSLSKLGYESMYQYQSAVNDTIDLIGKRILPDTVSIPVNAGWNWVSYLPNEALQPDEALATLVPLNNDVVKGRTAFAQYVAGIGWVGSLDFMSPPNGYMLKISNPGILVYPPDAMPGSPGNGFGELQQQELSDRSPGLWNVDPSQFEHSMNVVAVVGAGENLLDEGDAVGAFAGSQVRGGSEALWVEPLQSWLVFLTVYANENGEELSFKYYDASAEDIHRLNERFGFVVNDVQGTVEQPLVLTLEGTTDAMEMLSEGWFEVYPNPARETVFVAFGMKAQEAVTVRVTDGMGRRVREFGVEGTEGLNMVRWDTEGVATGQYLVSLCSGSGVQTRRVTVIR